MLSYRVFLCGLVATTACSDPASSSGPDAGEANDAATTLDSSTVDAAPACANDGRVYVAVRLGDELEITSYTEIVGTPTDVAEEVTCGAETTGLAALLDGSVFVGLANGGISRVTATACTALTIAPALTGEIALVGLGNGLLALERTGGGLWRIDPATGAATKLSTITGVTAGTSLVGGSGGAMVYIPAGLGGQGTLIPLDANGQPRPVRAVTGASSSQAQANWVAMVGHVDGLWLTMAGYYGAGGSPRTRWFPVANDEAGAAPIEYYASTIAATAATCD
jgi:hypothetical protein